MLPRPAACLFDLDGLLLDTEPAHAHAWQETARQFGRPLTEAELQALRGRRRLDCAEQVRRWIAAAGGPPLSDEALLAVRQPIAEALLASAPAMPGAEALVRRCLTLGIPMALATSSSRPAVEIKVAPHAWIALISERVHGDDPELSDGKPAPDPFLLAARRLGVAPTACWAFEDSLAGVAAARAAGCRVHVLLPPGVSCDAYPGDVHCLRSLEEVRLNQ
ncbi:HAD family phosphatase [Synechococcus sp. CCY 9618]|uniref:HAD family hydrolase n=1 Tax=Synechococcus sp. CCY 9618 TaxID=2815602 RepID=UPI001C230C78|nr:HAD family phosphatase [Synechococcus sp. CCY 9618]